MSNYIKTPSSVVNPKWTKRNQIIGKLIQDNKTVLDLGCGGKDLLNYIKPSKYHGIDYNDDLADSYADFNKPFEINDTWDYIVCSGLLEYLEDINTIIQSIQNKADTYIVTYWTHAQKNTSFHNIGALSIDQFIQILSKYFNIKSTTTWREHIIFVLGDI